MMNFSNALDKTLDRYGISAKWLSEQSGVSQQMISGFRNGKQRIYSDSLEKLLAALPNEVKDYFFGLMGSANLEAAIASMDDAEVSDLLILVAKRFNKAPNQTRDINLVNV
ncbi:helix-turn-helix transcriptional regulator [Coleofasciculus sp. FACHB-501]|uniref:helix-turn-helix domain-containing protein n=1 Tax=Cyanophyceae TaxID=3028117 RepID=UPI001687A9BA|nr:helix-turn-helix transcriptional regulator [Coleofasciculus sp. FACHB-501]MBD1836657.1 helix-turn-helix domain-containing protein [Coleofasciculus sp. FACHB-501]